MQPIRCVPQHYHVAVFNCAADAGGWAYEDEMSDDIETLRVFIGSREESSCTYYDDDAIDAAGALERVATKQGHYHNVLKELREGLLRVEAERNSLRKALDDRHADDVKAWKAIMRATGKERGLPDNKEVVAFYVAEVERLEKALQDAQDTIMGHEIAGAIFEKYRDSLRAKLDRAKEALGVFAAIKPSSLFPEDGSEAEGYIVTLKENYGNPQEFTGRDLARARAVLSDLSADAPAQQSDVASVSLPGGRGGVCGGAGSGWYAMWPASYWEPPVGFGGGGGSGGYSRDGLGRLFYKGVRKVEPGVPFSVQPGEPFIIDLPENAPAQQTQISDEVREALQSTLSRMLPLSTEGGDGTIFGTKHTNAVRAAIGVTKPGDLE
jgi:hypothetical protein